MKRIHHASVLIVAVFASAALVGCSKKASSKSASGDTRPAAMTNPPVVRSDTDNSDGADSAGADSAVTESAPTNPASDRADSTVTDVTNPIVTGEPDTGSSVTTTKSGQPIKPVAIPSTQTGTQLQWIIDHGRTATSADLTDHFSQSFLTQVPSDQLIGIFGQLGTLTLVDLGVSSDQELSGLVTAGDGTKFTVTMKLDASSKIEELLFKPFADLVPSKAKTWNEVDREIAAIGLNYSMFAGEIASDGSVRELHGTRPDTPGPLGSEFKLYVLGALSKAVEAKSIAWDEELTISDALKSIPSGELQDRPTGSKVTVREAAQKMIEISDNTATDMLINRLQRAKVEAVLTEMGMGTQSQKKTLPFITTREMSILKFKVEPTVRMTYESASEAQRLVMLKALPAELPAVTTLTSASPTAINTIEWFASPKEVAMAHAWLDKRAELPGMEPLREILGTNPGLPLDDKVWKRHSFKGGSEPGVLALSWLLERADGKRFVLAINTSSDKPIDEDDVKLFSAVTGAFNVLAA